MLMAGTDLSAIITSSSSASSRLEAKAKGNSTYKGLESLACLSFKWLVGDEGLRHWFRDSGETEQRPLESRNFECETSLLGSWA